MSAEWSKLSITPGWYAHWWTVGFRWQWEPDVRGVIVEIGPLHVFFRVGEKDG